MKTKKTLAWHFVNNNGKLGYNDNRVVKVGSTYTCKGVPKLCKNGMHASKRAIDALRYAPGNIVCLVYMDVVEKDIDKIVGKSRKVLYMADSSIVLQKFALIVAKEALDAVKSSGGFTDIRSYEAIEAKHKYLNGALDEDSMKTAASAAYAASSASSYDASSSAAYAASYASKTKDRQNAILSEMLLQLLLNKPEGKLK